MTPQVNREEALRLFEHINANPGIGKWQLARELGLTPNAVEARLPGLELVGLLLSEDDRGKLHCFGFDSWRWANPISWNGRVKDGQAQEYPVV